MLSAGAGVVHKGHVDVPNKLTVINIMDEEEKPWLYAGSFID